ncbi:hypothetical protein [Coleofasciculus sp. G2-EDA-02]|uniref:hypothetical protein n=1 Tax=unclassified Coleofasciculus TaxID=2692782 RepID=UPI0032FBD248
MIMGTHSEEQSMSDEVLIHKSLQYAGLIDEYLTLASKRQLTHSQAERLSNILQQAEADSWLEFLIDEADHILAHELGLINEDFINYQQDELKQLLDRQWCEQLLQQTREIRQQNCLKELQTSLQRQGLYDGDIDGKFTSLPQSVKELLESKRAEYGDTGRLSRF